MAATQESGFGLGILGRFKQFGLHPFSQVLAAGKNRRKQLEQTTQKPFVPTLRLRMAGTSYTVVTARKTG